MFLGPETETNSDVRQQSAGQLQGLVSFALTGAVAGCVLMCIGLIAPLAFVFGVGPTVIGACLLAAATERIHLSPARTVIALVLSVPAYVCSFALFAEVASLVQQHAGITSSSLSDLKADTLWGLIAGALLSGVLLEGLAFILSGDWSSEALLCLITGGIFAVVCAYLLKQLLVGVHIRPEGSAEVFAFFGPLFVLGGAISSGVIGGQMLRARRTTQFMPPVRTAS